MDGVLALKEYKYVTTLRKENHSRSSVRCNCHCGDFTKRRLIDNFLLRTFLPNYEKRLFADTISRKDGRMWFTQQALSVSS